MALYSLEELGASQERIKEFYLHDIKKLEPKKKSSSLIDRSNWMEYLGKYEHEEDYFCFFEKEIQSSSLRLVIEEYFDFLMKGVGAAAFHPLIRLSYAVKANHPEEIIKSLASWAASYLDLGDIDSVEGEISVEDMLGIFIENNFNEGKAFVDATISQRMMTVSRLSLFKDNFNKISLHSIRPDGLEESLLWLFSQTNNFTLLHGITSHHAFETLLPFSREKNSARLFMWKALLAAYLSTSGTVLVDTGWAYPSRDLERWDVLKSEAIKSNDDHVIKLVHTLSCKRNNKLDYEFRYASSLKLGLRTL
jgi:hypothetical protein